MNPWLAGLLAGVLVQFGLIAVDQVLKIAAALDIAARYGTRMSDEEFRRVVSQSRLAKVSWAWQCIAWWPLLIAQWLRG